MPTIQTDEVSFQVNFYTQIFPNGLYDVNISKNTDGYTNNIIFEHKQNVTSYGKAKALSQALIYLARFNRDGVPIPAKICLVSQDENRCFIYDAIDYIEIINDIENYANLKASDGIADFKANEPSEIIEFDLSYEKGKKAIKEFVREQRHNVKININEHNVYGWANFYYENALNFKQKPEKKAFFAELKEPKGTLKKYINAWQGQEIDFKYIMDMLNDPMTQKKLGAFYTPALYAKLGLNLVKKAVERAMGGGGKTDYVIIDRCAGSGNLEQEFDDELLSHTIISTYELKEWMVLKDRLGGRVRYIIPPIPKDKKLPNLNDEGFLSGANALGKDLINHPEIRKYLDNPKCAVILYENPPYAETTSIEFQKKKKGKESSSWKQNFVINEMKKEVKGAATNDLANAFIWSAFKYFLRDKLDSYIVFSPIKYYKSQHLISKKFMDGYALNRRHFHAPTDACVSLIWWANENDTKSTEISLKAMDIVNHQLENQGKMAVKKVYSLLSEKFYDRRKFESDKTDGIAISLNGLEAIEKNETQIRVDRRYNENILGYMITNMFGFDNARLNCAFVISGRYDGNGFFLRNDNFLEKLPIFAAGKFTDHQNDWKIMSMIMRSGDKAEQYLKDVKSGALDKFLFKTMFWTCLSHYPHLRSLYGSDGRLYKNELCFDGDTLAKKTMQDFIDKGYKLSDTEKDLLNEFNEILESVKTTEEYRDDFKYGLYQIDEEINIKIKQGFNANGEPKMAFKYGDLNNQIKAFKVKIKEYYKEQLVDVLFEYEFLK
ncbi:hypothetical protein [Campylobacter helveticus]|uniref:hypothetical protein n=2 Tax=Campylobacter helveticus TaxID=28898 RepID=UPI00214A52AF|nr:hypothetical protein [Campylobacter helveticus]MCR2064976.1 hypothetical protein [Campylobacter helveticus]